MWSIHRRLRPGPARRTNPASRRRGEPETRNTPEEAVTVPLLVGVPSPQFMVELKSATVPEGFESWKLPTSPLKTTFRSEYARGSGHRSAAGRGPIAPVYGRAEIGNCAGGIRVLEAAHFAVEDHARRHGEIDPGSVDERGIGNGDIVADVRACARVRDDGNSRHITAFLNIGVRARQAELARSACGRD